MAKVLDLVLYRNKRKTQTWLYKISFHMLFSEFIETYNRLEANPHCTDTNDWLDIVSDALNERFFLKNDQKDGSSN